MCFYEEVTLDFETLTAMKILANYFGAAPDTDIRGLINTIYVETIEEMSQLGRDNPSHPTYKEWNKVSVATQEQMTKEYQVIQIHNTPHICVTGIVLTLEDMWPVDREAVIEIFDDLTGNHLKVEAIESLFNGRYILKIERGDDKPHWQFCDSYIEFAIPKSELTEKYVP